MGKTVEMPITDLKEGSCSGKKFPFHSFAGLGVAIMSLFFSLACIINRIHFIME